MIDFNSRENIAAAYAELREAFICAETPEQFKELVNDSTGMLAAISLEHGVYWFGGLSLQGMLALRKQIQVAVAATLEQALREEEMLAGPIAGEA